MKQIIHKFDEILDLIQGILLSVLVKIGPFFVALMPAMFTAYATYHTFAIEADHRLALFFGLVVGVAIETVGIVATHSAVDLYNAWQTGITQPIKFFVMAALVPVYVVTVALIVYFAPNAFTDLVRGLGIGSPFLTCIVYIAVALAGDIRRIEAKQEAIEDKQGALEADALVWEREKERLILEQKHNEKLARIEAKNRPIARPIERLELDDLPSNQGKNGKKEQNLDAVLMFLDGKPDASLAEIGRYIGRSKSTAENYVNELMDAGRLIKNGHGYEVKQ